MNHKRTSLHAAARQDAFDVVMQLLIDFLEPLAARHWTDLVNLCMTSPCMARKFLTHYVRVWKERGVQRCLRPPPNVPWCMQLAIYTCTAPIAVGHMIEYRRQHVFYNGSSSLRTRMCRGCGYTTQRIIFGTPMCELCSRQRFQRSYMPTREMATKVAEVLYGLGGMTPLTSPSKLLDTIPWLRIRMGEVAPLDMVCDAIGVCRCGYVDAESLVFL